MFYRCYRAFAQPMLPTPVLWEHQLLCYTPLYCLRSEPDLAAVSQQPSKTVHSWHTLLVLYRGNKLLVRLADYALCVCLQWAPTMKLQSVSLIQALCSWLQVSSQPSLCYSSQCAAALQQHTLRSAATPPAMRLNRLMPAVHSQHGDGTTSSKRIHCQYDLQQRERTGGCKPAPKYSSVYIPPSKLGCRAEVTPFFCTVPQLMSGRTHLYSGNLTWA